MKSKFQGFRVSSFSIALFAMLALGACTKKSSVSPVKRTVYDTSFDKVYEKTYGSYYKKEGINQNVVALDFYSKGLDLDSVGRMRGTGTNLYFSDVFLPETIQDFAAVGDTVLRCDSTADAYTFLRGMEFEGSFSGAYLLYVEESQLQSISLIEAGEIEKRGDSIYFRLQYDKTKTYEAAFYGAGL